MVKQLIVVRKNLNMRKGKMCAQAAHAAMGFLTDQVDIRFLESDEKNIASIFLNPESKEWLETGMTKIVVGVESEKELLDLCDKAREAGLKTYLVQDEGRTEFKGPTYTALAIGPNWDFKIDRITGELKLL